MPQICNNFLRALEQKKYGWFLECPNGDKCVYRHALPPGFVLKQKEVKKDEPVEERPLDEILVELRSKLTGPLTPVTPETFKAWKAKKLQEKEDTRQKEEKERQESIKTGKAQMSGRELLDFRLELFLDDDETMDIQAFVGENVEEEEEEGENKAEDGPQNYDPNEQDHDDDLVERVKQAQLDGDSNNNNNNNDEEDEDVEENNNDNVPIDESLFTDNADIRSGRSRINIV